MLTKQGGISAHFVSISSPFDKHLLNLLQLRRNSFSLRAMGGGGGGKEEMEEVALSPENHHPHFHLTICFSICVATFSLRIISPVVASLHPSISSTSLFPTKASSIYPSCTKLCHCLCLRSHRASHLPFSIVSVSSSPSHHAVF